MKDPKKEPMHEGFNNPSTGEVYCAYGAPMQTIYDHMGMVDGAVRSGPMASDGGVVTPPSGNVPAMPAQSMHDHVNLQRMAMGQSQGGKKKVRGVLLVEGNDKMLSLDEKIKKAYELFKIMGYALREGSTCNIDNTWLAYREGQWIEWKGQINEE